MNDFIVNKDKQPFKVLKTVAFAWQDNLLCEIEPDSPLAICKKVLTTEKDFGYFLKKGLLGQFYDPWNMYQTGKHSLLYKDAAGRTWQWAKVPKEAFDQYISFLMTKNKSRYAAATKIYLYGDKYEKRKID